MGLASRGKWFGFQRRIKLSHFATPGLCDGIPLGFKHYPQLLHRNFDFELVVAGKENRWPGRTYSTENSEEPIGENDAGMWSLDGEVVCPDFPGSHQWRLVAGFPAVVSKAAQSGSLYDCASSSGENSGYGIESALIFMSKTHAWAEVL